MSILQSINSTTNLPRSFLQSAIPGDISPAFPVDDRILRWPEVHALTGICRSHAHALAAQNLFPRPVKIGLRASGWIESEIRTWVQNRIEMSRRSNVGSVQ